MALQLAFMLLCLCDVNITHMCNYVLKKLDDTSMYTRSVISVQGLKIFTFCVRI